MEQITLFLLIRLVKSLLAIISFMSLLSLDVWKAWKSKAWWIPQRALVLSAFSIQLLDILDTQTVSISDYPSSKKYDIIRVVENELLVDGGRVMVCVYMGYLLPQMARSPKSVVWNDIGALALSVFSHIFSELYVFNELYGNLREDNIPVNTLSIASRACTMICSTLLFLLLGSAAFAGKTLHTLVCEKIPLALKEDTPLDHQIPKNVENDVLRSWVVAWVCRPDYVISTSVLASSVGLLVTLAVGCYAAEWATQDYKVLHFNDGIDWFRYIVTGFMAFLILMGWVIIFVRWMFAIVYFPVKYNMPLEDFWTRHIFEVMENIEFSQASWDQRVSGGGFLENLKLRVMRAFKVHVFLFGPLLCLQRNVICFSRFCCFLSEKLFFAKIIRSRVFRDVNHELKYAFVKAGEFPQCFLPGSGNAIKKIISFMEKGRKEGKKSEKLIDLLVKNAFTDQNSAGKYFLATLRKRLEEDTRFNYLTKLSWKMTVLSLIQLMIELNDKQANGALKDALEAYSEAYVFLDLLDNPVGACEDYNPELFVRAADKQFKMMKSYLHGSGERSRGERSRRENSANNRVDSVDWWEVAENNSLDKVRETILENVTNSQTAQYSYSMEGVQMLLADILWIALKEEVGRELVINCRGWAEKLDDEKIKASVYVAGNLRGVIAELEKGSDSRKAADGGCATTSTSHQ